MEIVFEKKDSAWVSEFEATSDFNLHIEGVLEGNVRVLQSTVKGGGYAFVRGSTPYPTYGNVYDYTFTDFVYPKYIKVECATEPTMAVVTYNA